MGLILYLAIQHGANTAFAGAFTGALGAALSMGTGEYLGDGSSQLRPALAMGLSTLVCSLTPALPLLISTGTLAILSSLLIALILCGLVAHLRPESALPSIIKTYGGFIICVGGALGISLLVN